MHKYKRSYLNHETLKDLVRKFNIPFQVSVLRGLSREEHEDKMMKNSEYEPELIVLAKYMRILTPKFVQTFPKKVLNIHHSFYQHLLSKSI